MELYHFYVNIIFALSHFFQFGTARWSPSAFTKSSTEHENDNISIITTRILTNCVKYPGERYQAHFGPLVFLRGTESCLRISRIYVHVNTDRE